jgi:hypothetical protein
LKLEIDIDELSEGWHHAGDVSVDTGTLLIADPCYVTNWNDLNSEMIYDIFVEFTDILDSKGLLPEKMEPGEIEKIAREHDSLRVRYGELQVPGGSATAVVTKTGIGDGRYPVYAKVEKDSISETGRVVGVWIDFLCGKHLPDDE